MMKNYFGKNLKFLDVKRDMVANFKQECEAQSRQREEQVKLADETVSRCPICHSSSILPSGSVISGITYLICQDCKHMFTERKFTPENLNKLYSHTAFNQAEYLNSRMAQIRLEQIYRPKLDFIVSSFEESRIRSPKRFLDVGAGAGGFVRVCKDSGFEIVGLEPDLQLRTAAMEQYNVELDSRRLEDIVQYGDKYDIITFWGVLEHINSPLEMLRDASKILQEDGWIIAEVPRGLCLSTLIQSCFPERVVRHLDPISHIHLFSDESIKALLNRSNLVCEMNWYFGMDAYELLLQIITHLDISIDNIDRGLIDQFINQLQSKADAYALSDTITWGAGLRHDGGENE